MQWGLLLVLNYHLRLYDIRCVNERGAAMVYQWRVVAGARRQAVLPPLARRCVDVLVCATLLFKQILELRLTVHAHLVRAELELHRPQSKVLVAKARLLCAYRHVLEPDAIEEVAPVACLRLGV